jgi:type IV pilus assembly protein PilX
MRRPETIRRDQQGSSLVVVLMVLVVVTLLGITGAQMTLLGEKSSRYERDQQIAFQAAEAALIEAADEIEGRSRGAGANLRSDLFKADSTITGVNAGSCGTSGTMRGVCVGNDAATKPLWATVDFTDDSSTAPSAAYGEFTGASYAAGSGVQPARKPRYIIEELPYSGTGGPATIGAQTKASRMFRVTAMGFGPKIETQTVLQMEYIKAKEN